MELHLAENWVELTGNLWVAERVVLLAAWSVDYLVEKMEEKLVEWKAEKSVDRKVELTASQMAESSDKRRVVKKVEKLDN